jgi:predicted type IV restriction endonuclease
LDREELFALVRRVRSDGRVDTYDEASTKQTVILPMLSALGWNIFDIDEVCPEYSVHGGSVDYALRCRRGAKVFVEVKKPHEDLSNHQEQLLNYAFKQGVPEAVLTNGITWWLYLPLREGSWEQRKFYTIEIRDQN